MGLGLRHTQRSSAGRMPRPTPNITTNKVAATHALSSHSGIGPLIRHADAKRTAGVGQR
jgi:hypothetical protein